MIAASLQLEKSHREITEKHAKAFLRLLNAIIDPRLATVPPDLGKVLDLCLASDPTVATERAFIRLDGLRRQRDA